MSEQMIKELIEAKIPGEDTGITVKTGICGFCGGSCFIDVYEKDGKIIKVEGNKTMPGANGRICVKGAAMKQALYSPKRLLYPMKRVGARGSDVFERITWDEAFTIIGEKLNESREKYGAEASLFYVGHPKWFRYQATELANAFGTPNFGTESSSCAYAVMLANQCIYGNGVRFLPPDLKNCRALVVWGVNSAYSNSVQPWAGLMKAKERGVKLVVIDPRCTPTTEMADIHLRPMPGTDGALALGIARVIITENLQNQEYIDQYTTGYEVYKEYVMQFTPEYTEELTGVPKDDMIRAAHMMAENAPFPIMLSASPLVHNINGVQNVRAVNLLLALTGSYGVSGGSMAPGPGRAFFRDTMGTPIARIHAEEDLSHEEFPAWAKINSHEVQIIRLADYIEQENGIKTILSFGMNHHMWPRPDRIESAFDKLDFFVSADIYMTDTCKYADLVLPVQPSLERDQIEILGLDMLYYQEHVTGPAGEAKTDMDILAGIAEKLGVTIGGEIPVRSNEDFMNKIMMPTGVTLKELKAAPNHMMKAKNVTPPRTTEQILKVKTPSGKIEFVSSVLSECEKPGHEGLPVYHDFREKLPLDEYPFILSTGSRKPQLFHSRTYRIPWLAELETYPLAEIHPEDAKKYGLSDGDRVILETPVGSMEFTLSENSGTLKGTVNVYHGAGADDINYILDDDYLDPISGFPGYKSYCCRLERKEK